MRQKWILPVFVIGILMAARVIQAQSGAPVELHATSEDGGLTVTLLAPAGYQESGPHEFTSSRETERLRIGFWEAGTPPGVAVADAGGNGLETRTQFISPASWTVANTDLTAYAALETSNATYVLVGVIQDTARMPAYLQTTFKAFMQSFTEGDTVSMLGQISAEQLIALAPPEEVASNPDDGLRALDFTPFEAALEAFTSGRMAAVEAIAFEASIDDLQAAFEAGTLTSEDLTLYYLARIQAYDVDRLRAVIELNPEALTIARALDEERQAGQRRGPLHGIPVLLKDNIATGDRLHTTTGAAALMDAQAHRDAMLVASLRAAGAVILGKTNLSEWANFISTRLPNGFSAVGGQVVSPYDARFDPLGSSTGSAVAVAADLVSVAVGTETQGSVIAPAAANSVVGMYPSLGLVSRDRIIPITAQMDTAGPIARSVPDLAVLLTAMSSPDANDPRSADASALHGADFTTRLDAKALQGIRIGILVREGVDPDQYVRTFLTQDVATALETAGAELVFLPFPTAQIDVLPVFFHDMRTGVDAYLQDTAAPVGSLAEIVQLNADNAETYIPYGQDLLVQAADDTASDEDIRALAARNREQAQATIGALLDEHEVAALVSLDAEMANLYAPAGFPAITVPGGYRRNGQPFGVTFIGDYLSDGDLIGYAFAFEQASHLRFPPVLDR